MKRFVKAIAAICVTVIAQSAWLELQAQKEASENLNGYWLFNIDYMGKPMLKVVLIKDNDGSLSGNIVNETAALNGGMAGKKMSLQARPINGGPAQFDGMFAAGSLSGTVALTEPVTGKMLQTTWKGSRFPMERPGPGKRIDFVPTSFHLGYASDIPPALHCWPGDTVYTETVDCNGFDKQGVHRVMEGNAEIGPFYIESAMPGDVLAVHFVKIRLNRDWASSAEHLMSRAISHDYAAHAKLDDKVVKWNLDLKSGLAIPADQSGHLKNYVLPVKPMLGCVGLATGFWVYPYPAIDSGPMGGNMDFVMMNEGCTLYLSVFQPGALLFMGDGHALQGDGELNLDALETSLDVGFTVELIRGGAAKLGQPRAENETYLMAIGLNGSLDEAFRDATTELANWLEQDYDLTAGETAIVLGTSIEYQITEVADRNVSVVARMQKSRLAKIKPSSKSNN